MISDVNHTMRIALIINPSSGRGKAKARADAIEYGAKERGHTIDTLEIGRGAHPDGDRIADADIGIIVGGDGTVHHLLPQLIASQTPFLHCGTGTANLICHALKMPTKPAGVLRQIELESEPKRIDVPTCNDHPFLIMTSLGMDASVIHRLEESRSLGGYRAYVRPVIREVLSPQFAHARVSIDEIPYPELMRPGVIVVANMPNYGGHFNPCANASWSDAQLDVAHIPATTSLTAGLRYLALRARIPAATTARGRTITITGKLPTRVQIDGERPQAIPHTLAPDTALSFTLSPHTVLAHAPELH
jgi:diacylglycerol kinase (ATP)